MGGRAGSLKLASPEILENPVEDELDSNGSGRWLVTVFDNNHNSVDEVIFILILATRCTMQEAEMETWEIHNLGKSVVFHGAESQCHQVAQVIATIGIKVEVSLES